MLQEERQNRILKELNLHGRVMIAELCDLLKVSTDTIRRDLGELERKGHAKKVHGGAIATDYTLPYQQPSIYAQEEKRAIARKALGLIADGDLTLMGGGTVMLELARIIPDNLPGTIFTVSPLVALEIAQRSKVNVVLLGGNVSRGTYMCTGAAVIAQLAELRVNRCFLDANGLAPDEGVTERDWEVAQVKKAMIKSAEHVAVLAISEKLGTVQKMQVTTLSRLDHLVTELPAGDPQLGAYASVVTII